MNRPFFEYVEAMRYLGCSTHPHQLQRRIAKYPNEVITINGTSYISQAYTEALLHRHHGEAAISQLLQKQGGTL